MKSNFFVISTILYIDTLKSSSIGKNSNVSVYSQYECSEALLLKKIRGSFTFKANIPCTGIRESKQEDTYEIHLNDNQIFSVMVIHTDTTSLYLNGISTHYQTGKIDHKFCGRASVHIMYLNLPSNSEGCSSENGLTHTESIEATFDIRGGKCHGSCNGKVFISYDPGIMD